MRTILEEAGCAALFSEAGIAWANHELVTEDRWPEAWDSEGPITHQTWEQLQGNAKRRVIALRLSPLAYSRVALRARREGRSMQAWAVDTLERAVSLDLES